MDIKISVILPVHNMEKYIDRCIGSLKAQTLDGLEFIFVDDLGTDSSMSHVEEFAASDSRVRIIRNTKNMGAGASRNAGIEAARGRYLSFVDPDDYIAPDFYSLLYSKALTNRADAVKGISRIDGRNRLPSYDPDKRLKKALKHGFPVYYRFTDRHFTAIYKRSLFDDPLARYGTTHYGEDTTFLLRTLYGIKSFALEERAIYHYRMHSENTTASLTPRRCMEELASLKEKLDFLLGKPQDRFTRLYIRGRLRHYFNNVCVTPRCSEPLRQNAEYMSDFTAAYLSTLKAQLDRVPKSVLSPKYLEELTIFLRYGEVLSTEPRDYDGSYRQRFTEWTDFLVRHPDAGRDLLRGYAYMILQSFSRTDLPFRNLSGHGSRLHEPFRREQFGRLGKKQKRRVLLFLPPCLADYAVRSYKYGVLGLGE
jgi:glycosyltransferase involved in cell wall biosynthesis